MRAGFVIWIVLLLTEYTHAAVLTEADFCITKCCKRKKCLNEGDYQSCNGCNVYATCGVLDTFIDNRPCPMGDDGRQEEWDDNLKRCVPYGFSDTCGSGMSRTTAPPPETTQAITCAPEPTTAMMPTEGTGVTNPGQCITSCSGMRNGNYQSCKNCNVYATCYNGDLYDDRPCSTVTTLVWNDYHKMCVWPYQDNTCDAPVGGYDEITIAPSNVTEAPSNVTEEPIPEQTVCRRIITQVLNVTVDGDCLAPQILQTRCEGQCVSGEIYAGVSDFPDTSCFCCKASETVQQPVVVTCPVVSDTDDLGGTTQATDTTQTFEKTYFYPLAKTCGCVPCEG